MATRGASTGWYRGIYAERLQLPGLRDVCADAPGDAVRPSGLLRLRRASQVRLAADMPPAILPDCSGMYQAGNDTCGVLQDGVPALQRAIPHASGG